MALDLITGHQGVAHISAEQISDINKAMMNGYGDNKVMRMSGGAITQNSLTLEIATGYWRANGFDIQIQESETHYIDPSTIGTSRIDNIYVELLQDIPTGAQRAEITIIMGEEAASPVAPEDPTEPYLNTDILLDAVQIGTVTVTEGAMVFTDLTEEYDLVTPSELSAVQTLANNALGMIQDDSDAYSSSKAYAVGDLCIHDDKVYKCITACSPAVWSVNQNCFSATTLTDEVSTLKDALNVQKVTSGIISTAGSSASSLSYIMWRQGKKRTLNITFSCSVVLNPNAWILIGTLNTSEDIPSGFEFPITTQNGLACAGVIQATGQIKFLHQYQGGATIVNGAANISWYVD